MWFGCGREEKLLVFRAVQLFAASCSSSSNGLHFCNAMNCYKLSATYSSCGSLDPAYLLVAVLVFHSTAEARLDIHSQWYIQVASISSGD